MLLPGQLADRNNNRNIEVVMLTPWLQKRFLSDGLIGRTLRQLMWQCSSVRARGSTMQARMSTMCLACAIGLVIPVVADDQDMAALAEVFGDKAIATLELLRYMLDSGHTDMKAIDGLCDYWCHISDRPANFESDYKRLFMVSD